MYLKCKRNYKDILEKGKYYEVIQKETTLFGLLYYKIKGIPYDVTLFIVNDYFITLYEKRKNKFCDFKTFVYLCDIKKRKHAGE